MDTMHIQEFNQNFIFRALLDLNQFLGPKFGRVKQIIVVVFLCCP